MIVVDSSALMAIIRNEPDARSFVDIFATGDGFIISAGTLQELLIVTAHQGVEVGRVDELPTIYGISIVAVDETLARIAGEAGYGFGKGRHPAKLNFGDCFAYALAKARDLPLLFKGDDFSKTDIRDARIALA